MSSRRLCRLIFEETETTTLCFLNIEPKYHTIFISNHHCVVSKSIHFILHIGGDTPFCAFGYEIIDFYLTRKKTVRRYLRRLQYHTIYNQKRNDLIDSLIHNNLRGYFDGMRHKLNF